MQAGKSAQLGQPERDQDDRKYDDQHTLDGVRYGGRPEAPHDGVGRHHDPVDEIEDNRVGVGVEGLQFAMGVLLQKHLITGILLVRALQVGHLRQILEFLEFLDADLLFDGQDIEILGSQGHHRLGRHHVTNPAPDEGHDQGEGGVAAAKERALEALGEVVADRCQS